MHSTAFPCRIRSLSESALRCCRPERLGTARWRYLMSLRNMTCRPEVDSFSDYVHSTSQVTLEGFHFPGRVSRQCMHSMSASQPLMPANRASSRHFQ
jgi:hypothetical protein